MRQKVLAPLVHSLVATSTAQLSQASEQRGPRLSSGGCGTQQCGNLLNKIAQCQLLDSPRYIRFPSQMET